MIEESDHSETINTAFIERYNLTQRHCGAKSSRKKLSFAKRLEMLECQEDITSVYYNFLRPHTTLTEKNGYPTTPCMQAEVTNHMWTWEELLFYNFRR